MKSETAVEGKFVRGARARAVPAGARGTVAVLLSTSLGSAGVMAGDFDGSKPLLCAPMDSLRCEAGGECLRGGADRVNLPRFYKVDVAQKQVNAVGEDRSTAIMTMTREQGALILQGTQNGRAWNLSVAEASGDMTLTVAAERAGYVVFGACTPL